MIDNRQLKSKAVSGVIWNLVDAVGRRGLVFVFQILLARIIAPSEFGILGMVTIFIGIAETIAECGMTNAVIREKDTTQDEYSLVFFMNFGISIVMYGILVVCSHVIATYFNEPKLIRIIPIIGIVIVLNALSAIPKAIIIKKMLFRKQAIISIISVSTAGIVAICMARRGMGIWALVINTVLICVFEVIFSFLFIRWMPSVRFRCDALKKYFTFGWKLLAASLISSIYENIYSMIIGKKYSAVELGYYSNASKISSTIASSISQVAQKVSFPVMTQLQDSAEMLRRSYGKILQYAAFLCFPTMIGLLAVSDSFINGVMGEEWIPAIPYLKMLCIIGMMMPVHRINLNILYVKGRSDLVLKLEILKKAIGLTLVGIAFFVSDNVIQMLCYSILYETIAFLINTHYSEALIGYSAKKQIADLMPIVCASVLMGVVVYAFNLTALEWYVKLPLQIASGAMCYTVFSRIFAKELFFEAVDILRKTIRRGNHG